VSDGQGVLDGRTLNRLQELQGPRIIRGLVDIFVQTVPAKMDDREAAFRAGGAREVERAAHSIAGSAANVGAPELHRAARRLETEAHRGDLDGKEQLVTDVRGALNLTVDALARARPPD
jgi:HPt (histidine-containing phosphotransfer) domain-containing protein